VEEFFDPEIEQRQRAIAQSHGFELQDHALSLYAVNNGHFDKVPREKVVAAEAQLQSFAKTNAADLVKSINDKPELSKEVDAGLKKLCEDFFSSASF